MSYDKPTDDELRLLAALIGVCDQFMPGERPYVSHDFVSAGEWAVEILSNYGVIEKDDAGGSWATRALALDGAFRDGADLAAARLQYERLPFGERVIEKGVAESRKPDLQIAPVSLWFSALVKNRVSGRNGFPRDLLNVTARLLLCDATSKVAGELLTASDLRDFADELDGLRKRSTKLASLRGNQNSIVLKIEADADRNLQGSASLHNPMFKHTTSTTFDVSYENVWDWIKGIRKALEAVGATD